MAASLQVDRAQSNAMNLQVLKRQDDAVMDIVDTASHVVMYEFDQDGQSWVRSPCSPGSRSSSRCRWRRYQRQKKAPNAGRSR
jgi:hypothetical protein